jgi:hypothetical protein
MTWHEFEQLCKTHSVQHPKSAAESLVACGAVIVSSDGVHGHAPQAVNDFCNKFYLSGDSSFSAWNPCVDVELRMAQLKKEIALLRPGYENQLQLCVNSRRHLWSSFFAVSGLWLAAVSFNTFHALDWDTMEPITWATGSGVGVAYFTYTLCRGIDFTSRGTDRKVIQEKYIEHHDVVKYFEAVEELEELQSQVESKVKWIRTRK